MAQTIVTLCDVCLLHDNGRETPGQTWTLTVAAPGGKAVPMAIDVCEDHGKPYRVLLDHLTEDGRRADRARALPGVTGAARASATAGADPRTIPAPEGLRCPADGCAHVARTPGGLATHTRTQHGRSVAELEGRSSLPCPVDGCDRTFMGGQGRAVHLSRAHGMTTDEARAAVEESARE